MSENIAEEDNSEEVWQHAELKSKFDGYYEQVLAPFLKQKEDFRLKCVGQFWFFVWLSLFLLPMTGLVIYTFNKYTHSSISWSVLVVLAVVMFFVIRQPHKKYKQQIKNDSMELFAKFFDGFRYRNGQPINQKLMEMSLIFPKYDEITAQDAFFGKYADTMVTICEQTLKAVKMTKGKRNEKTVFQGIALELDMAKPFKAQTIVLKSGGLFGKAKTFEGMTRFKPDDSISNKYFEVYTGDIEEARNLLLPAFVKHLLKLKEAYKAKSIQIGFYSNRVLIGIETREDMFEPCEFFKTHLNKDKLDEIFEQFWAVFCIVHILKLNQTM